MRMTFTAENAEGAEKATPLFMRRVVCHCEEWNDEAIPIARRLLPLFFNGVAMTIFGRP